MIAMGTRESHDAGNLLVRTGIVTAIVVVCTFFHKQETLLIILFSIVFFGYQIGRILLRKPFLLRNAANSWWNWIWCPPRRIYWLVATVLSVYVLVGTFLFKEVLWTLERPLWNNTVTIKLPLGWQGTIADPTGRVFETFGLFGLVVMILYFFKTRKSDRILVLSIACVSPLLILFNPVFVHYFIQEVSHDTLWRISYMFPVGLVAAHVLLNLVLFRLPRWRPKVIVALILGISLVPLSAIEAWQNSRWTTLVGLKEENDHRVWGDLLEVLGTLEPANVLADPVTGYVVRAITKHTVFGFKFHESPPHIPINYLGYGPTSFEGYESWLFIQNQRDGSSSRNGRISGHWPEDIMKVSSRIGDGLASFLEEPPEHFRLVWEQDGIRLFKISSEPI